ncbi:hypothetical protein A3C57_00940 [Candidatus Nomurabacteria bacterium RIFCSPHIGHO2_02_FULL_33_12]|uniref:Uncharacterized protein n=1 Tax=Candidatus Nomurabacteria bacterium RIFCSPLOWO2_01_FULL_33_17 TaxID=1801764 RepID=A0A1F6WQM4_9BACT|nr:MAG: hypothetical protein A3C57_00940 [Candidatus Nomurabacteria bacterium RIFCSPHIGHO2_02_FULL_33_12]OGI84188.1 MAG: hypothetical protein A2903_00540 [Candidatus Nomurabacteria bacterium RIFCSPLOWO2_01_FULL_33_17]
MEHFKIFCGDWIYPSRDSSTKINYPIDIPLVAEIYPRSDRKGKMVSESGMIKEHLNSSRFLKLHLRTDNILCILSLHNETESMFLKEINEDISFDRETLARPNSLWYDGKYPGKIIKHKNREENEWNSIFFTSILLQVFMAGEKLPNGISFRNATIPEIESLGRW